MGADNMRKLMEASDMLNEKVYKIPPNKINWNEDKYGVPDVPTVEGLDIDWQFADAEEFTKESFRLIAKSVAKYGLNVYVIDATGGDYYWFGIGK